MAVNGTVGTGARLACGSALALACLLVLGACSSINLGPTPQVVSLSSGPTGKPAERQGPATAAEREHQRILTAYNGPYNDPRLEAMVNKTIARLVAASDQPEMQYRVVILNSPAVNAFALQSGQLYITRGLIALANDSSELASVLAHEISHVIAQHAASREEQAKQASLVDRVVNDVLTDPETGALALAKSKIKLAGFSRAQEFEADGIGVNIATRAGYDPHGAIRFLTSMGRNAELKANPGQTRIDPRAPDFLSSHPATVERIKNAQTVVRQSGAASGERDRAAYLAALDGLVYGEDPSEGFVRGRRFLHPKLGFTFLAPDGFTLDNTSQAVLGVKEGGGQALRFDVVSVAAEQSLSEYLTSGWIENIDKRSIEETTVNGFPTATATAKGDQWAFRLYVVRFGSEVYRFIFATKRMTPETDKGFREAVASFRRMSIAESKQARPLRLKVVQVQSGDTIDSLSKQMAVADRPAERFRVINGLGPHDRLTPGEQVKIAVE
jgi:predicted Zn-dependent protease